MLANVSNTVMSAARKFVWAVLLFVSGVLNFLTCGSAFEPLCARVGRNVLILKHPIWLWRAVARFLDTVYFAEPDHCRTAFVRAAQRKTRQPKWRIAWIWQ